MSSPADGRGRGGSNSSSPPPLPGHPTQQSPPPTQANQSQTAQTQSLHGSPSEPTDSSPCGSYPSTPDQQRSATRRSSAAKGTAQLGQGPRFARRAAVGDGTRLSISAARGEASIAVHTYPTDPSHTGPIGSQPPLPPSRPTQQPATNLLHTHIEEALNNAHDTELHQALHQHRSDTHPPTQRPSQTSIQDLAARFLDLAHGRLEARSALLYLANADWDLEEAFGVYAREAWDEGAGSGEQREGVLGDDEEEDDEEEVEGEVSVTDESGSESGAESNSPRSRLRRRNPHVDRKPAVKGKPDASKLSIKLRNIDGKEDIEKQYPRSVDWASSGSIRALNRWRQQVLRRNIGAAQEERVRFHPRELRFLFHAHRNHLLEAQAHRRPVEWNDMDWERITTDFNNNFEGRNLYGDPDGPVRPRRTAGALRSVRARVWEIVEMTGITPRPKKEMKKIMEGEGEGGEEGNGEGDEATGKKGGDGRDEGKKKGDRGGKRGSSGKK